MSVRSDLVSPDDVFGERRTGSRLLVERRGAATAPAVGGSRPSAARDRGDACCGE
ncbi:hypothetical protein [Streptomyces sp. NPDC048187]|uniref:hypothetical protein n=1 Tax=Streptomyces sp. NPDC048187 TaxID=3365509 RepID=UPI00371EB5A0